MNLGEMSDNTLRDIKSEFKLEIEELEEIKEKLRDKIYTIYHKVRDINNEIFKRKWKGKKTMILDHELVLVHDKIDKHVIVKLHQDKTFSLNCYCGHEIENLDKDEITDIDNVDITYMCQYCKKEFEF